MTLITACTCHAIFCQVEVALRGEDIVPLSLILDFWLPIALRGFTLLAIYSTAIISSVKTLIR